MALARPQGSRPALGLAVMGSILLVLVLILAFKDSTRISQPIRTQLLRFGAATGSPNIAVAPQRRWWEPPALAQWSMPLDFLVNCSELAPSGIPANHSSQLAPLLAPPTNGTTPYDVFYKEVEAATTATQATRSGAAPPEPISCLRDPPHAALRPIGDEPKIGIIVGYSAAPDAQDQDNMYARSLRDKHEYAAKHGYEVVVFGNVTLHGDKHILYLKWLGALMHLRRFDWVWTVDLDTIIMNHSIPLETFMDPRYDVILTRDCNGINCGTLFVRNSTWSWMFLAEVYMHSGDGIRDGPGEWPNRWSIWPEQAVVWKLNERDRIRNRLKILPQRAFNSYTGPDCAPEGTYHEGDFMVHFAGPGKPRFNEYWPKRALPPLSPNTSETQRSSPTSGTGTEEGAH